MGNNKVGVSPQCVPCDHSYDSMTSVALGLCGTCQLLQKRCYHHGWPGHCPKADQWFSGLPAKKWTLVIQPLHHWKKPQEMLPIALPCDKATRPPGCGEVSVERSRQRKSLWSHLGHWVWVFVFQNSSGASKPEKIGGKQHLGWSGWMQRWVLEESIQKKLMIQASYWTIDSKRSRIA